MEGYQAHPVLLEDCGVGVDQVGDVLTIICKAKTLVWQLDMRFHFIFTEKQMLSQLNRILKEPCLPKCLNLLTEFLKN